MTQPLARYGSFARRPRRLAQPLVAALLTVAVAACSGGQAPTATVTASHVTSGTFACVPGSITISGSTALQPLVEAAAKQYQAKCTGATISVQGGGSGTGLAQVSQGAVQIGDSDVDASSRLKPDEVGALQDWVVCLQGWLMVVNKKVTGVTNLTKSQAQDIWTGKITNWKDVGGPDATIVLILRPQSSGTRAVWRKLVLEGQVEASGQAITEDSNGAVTTAVEQTDYSTSIIGYAYYVTQQDKLTPVALNGVKASVETIKDSTYLVQALGHMYSKGAATGLTRAFLEYMLSPEVQLTLIPRESYVPAPKP